MNHLSPEYIILTNSTGDNVLAQKGNIYIDKSVHISFSERECEKIRALLGVSNDEYVRELEEKNKNLSKDNRKLSEDNKRLTDMVMNLQRQLIECLSSGKL